MMVHCQLVLIDFVCRRNLFRREAREPGAQSLRCWSRRCGEQSVKPCDRGWSQPKPLRSCKHRQRAALSVVSEKQGLSRPERLLNGYDARIEARRPEVFPVRCPQSHNIHRWLGLYNRCHRSRRGHRYRKCADHRSKITDPGSSGGVRRCDSIHSRERTSIPSVTGAQEDGRGL
jgi:hypothetical protein